MRKHYILFLTVLMTTVGFGQVFITEIADPNNNAEARYIELYNAGTTTVNFTEGSGWQIDKYLNATSGVNASLDLTGSIAAGAFYVIAYNNTDGTFASIYGFLPDQLDGVFNGVVGSNADDDLALVDGTDAIVDFFGIYDFDTDINTDNTGSCAEYEDGRAERLTSVISGSTTFNEAQWNVWADSTVSGCTSHQNSPRIAPDDFDPGAWGAATCSFSLLNPSSTCNAVTSGTDTYTATIDFTGGGGATYTVSASAGVIDFSSSNPTNDATGTITVTGLNEGENVTITVQDGGVCDVTLAVLAPSCEPPLTLPVYENFDFADGSSLVNNPKWDNFSGALGDLLISSGQALVKHGVSSEDAKIAFVSVSGDVYYAFDFSVIDPGSAISGGDFEYFAMFKNNGTSYAARLDIVEATTGGDFSVGIASDEGVADAVWATDLSFGTTYHATVRYNQDNNIAELWIDATAFADLSILSEDRPDPGVGITQFALRQSVSSNNEGILVDNLVISQTFNETLTTNEVSIQDNIRLYPNPTSKGFVNLISKDTSQIIVEVYDILGKLIKNSAFSKNKLNVSDLKSGIYILKISQNNTTTIKKLVIK